MGKRQQRAPSQRQLRIGEELRHILARILGQDQIRDPGLKDVTVTVTEVRVGSDLRTATVFVMPLGGGEVNAMVAALTRARSFLRRKVAQAIRLKYVPELVFCADRSFEYAGQIDNLFKDPSVARDLGTEAGDKEIGNGT
ncbi:MAG TPA: 30S ribosome-binding factor RbfA [Rhodospirillales bacterium]|jgi:ribosome-binding factor A|nr:30S ribosome-binding factor RbfA [Rhodospirillales bacterium]|tara:strand:- start:1101 stop:1520 length:420 start_codon:yes stop_codon:yes gene_type:complete